MTPGTALLGQGHLPPDLLLRVANVVNKALACLSLVTLTFCYLQLNDPDGQQYAVVVGIKLNDIIYLQLLRKLQITPEICYYLERWYRAIEKALDLDSEIQACIVASHLIRPSS